MGVHTHALGQQHGSVASPGVSTSADQHGVWRVVMVPSEQLQAFGVHHGHSICVGLQGESPAVGLLNLCPRTLSGQDREGKVKSKPTLFSVTFCHSLFHTGVELCHCAHTFWTSTSVGKGMLTLYVP